jgi:hypothetical protein
MGARAPIDEAVAKYRCGVKNNLRHPVRLQLAIPPVRRNEFGEVFWMGHYLVSSQIFSALINVKAGVK